MNQIRATNPAPAPGRRVRLGEARVQEGVLTPEQLARALAAQKSSGRMLGEMLGDTGVISGAHLVHVLGKTLGVKGCQIRHGLIDPAVFKLVGAEECERLLAIPMFKMHGTLTVAMTHPPNLPTIDRIRQLTGCRVRTVPALEANVREFVKKYAAGETSIDAFLTSLSEQDVEVVDREMVDEEPATDLDKMVAGSPIINLVNVALLTAIRDKASDIHIEPDKKGTRVRYRIDGSLRDLMKPPPGMHAAIVSRVKVIGKMDVAEKRLPQEGRVHIIAEGREIDLRVSSMPTLLGEKAGAADPRQGEPEGPAGRARVPAGRARGVQADAGQAARAGARHRPDRQRQDDHALLAVGPLHEGLCQRLGVEPDVAEYLLAECEPGLLAACASPAMTLAVGLAMRGAAWHNEATRTSGNEEVLSC